MAALRRKSIALTGYLESLLQSRCDSQVQIITAPEPEQRGCQLSLRLRTGQQRGRQVYERLANRGVVCDWREPDSIRLAPVPLYNGFEDVLRAACHLAAAVQETG